MNATIFRLPLSLSLLAFLFCLLQPDVASAYSKSKKDRIRHNEYLDPRIIRASVFYVGYGTDRSNFANGSPVSIINPATGAEFSDPSSGAGFSIDGTYFIYEKFAVEVAVSYEEGYRNRLSFGPEGDRETLDYRYGYIPVDLNFQYHFAPYGKLTPYVGAGVTYAFMMDSNFSNSFGFNTKLGVDYWSKGPWGISLAAKQYFGLETDLELFFPENNIEYLGEFELNPTIISLGVAYRF